MSILSKRYVDALEGLNGAIGEVRDAFREMHGEPPGVISAWVIVLAESNYDDDGDATASTVSFSPDHIPIWQEVGLLQVALAEDLAYLQRGV